MTGYTIDAQGWVRGEFPGLDMDYPVEVIPGGNPHIPLDVDVPDLCLHTTEGSHVNPAIEFEPQWLVGEFRVVQLHPVHAKGFSVDTMDGKLMQIECVEMSTLTLGVFDDKTQMPLVALLAFLQHEGLVQSAIARPSPFRNLPQVLDRLPAAVNTYYRRFLGWPLHFHGAGGHVDCPDDEHWDPGSYDYVTAFEQVTRLLDSRYGGDDVTGDEIVQGWRFRLNNPDKPLDEKADDGFQVGWHIRDLVEKGLHSPVQHPGGGGGIPVHDHLTGPPRKIPAPK